MTQQGSQNTGVVFDLDETIIDRSRAVSTFAAKLWSLHFSGGSISESAFIEAVHGIDKHGYRPRVEFFDLMTQQFGDIIGGRETIERAFFSEVWETPVLADGVKQCLKRLQQAEVPIGLVSNGSTKAQTTKLQQSGLDTMFDVVVVSEAFGVKKPDESIYLAAANEMNIRPEQSWFVGDHPVNDIWGSKQVGFKTAWIHLNRPWASDIAPCFDIQAASFGEAMTQVMELIFNE